MGKLYLTAAFVLAGSSVVAARSVSDYLQPFSITFMSLLFAAVTALIVSGRELPAAMRRLNRSVWLKLILQSFFGIFLFRVFLTYGLLHTSTAEAGIITGTAPAWTAFLTYLILRDRLHARCLAGIALTVVGVLILQGLFFEATPFGSGHLLGNALALAATACEAMFTVLARKIHLAGDRDGELRPVIQAGIVSFIALLLCLVPAALEAPLSALQTLPPAGWLALIWYGSIVTIVAFACMFAGAKRCDGYTIAAISGVIPLSSLALSILVLGEPVKLHQWLGCAFIIAAILVINRRAG